MRVALQNKVVLITGASSGIGALVAKLLAERGAIPVLTARSREKMLELAASIRGEHAVYEMDVTSDEQVEQVVSQVLARYGKIDVLLNNAGYGEFIPFTETRIDDFSDMMDVNFLGTVRCARAVLPSMLQAGQGHIVNVASMAGKMATAKSTAYSATKHAVLGFTNALRQELLGSGVRVSAVNPGPIDTPFFDRADPEGNYVRNIKWFMMSPDKVAGAIVSVIERRKPELDLPWTASVGVKFMQAFPRIGNALFGRLMNKK
ncbi:SDR family NAD(P)-dependent oxidoreductase [Cohnella cholangitidis]|uniref:SDR family oxidoreductase n=1 Tax=Cohnella cholangitidis TaxID=2598458 RepID=A0A7G5C6S3_9BACL|nr:SDR family oxidoreductase [Cohnella cholangitidis]QMV44907.1 SDR family oxidoreductase [Cohnella cholangitidis]